MLHIMPLGDYLIHCIVYTKKNKIDKHLADIKLIFETKRWLQKEIMQPCPRKVCPRWNFHRIFIDAMIFVILFTLGKYIHEKLCDQRL